MCSSPRILRNTALTLTFLATLARGALAAEKPALSGQIDQIIQDRLDQAKVPASPRADDAEFLRRVYLDIAGRIPTYEQTTAFLASKEPDKRVRLIDELLARSEYGYHFATIWRDLIVDRTPEMSSVRQKNSWDFIEWLAAGLNKDRGWDQIVTDMLTAEGDASSNPASSFILANRMNDFPRAADMVSSAGSLFMGISIRCAQCHNHPNVDQWKQDDFWGMAAFFNQVRDHGFTANAKSRNPTFYERPLPDAKINAGYNNRLKKAGLLVPVDGPRIGVPKVSDPTETRRVVSAKLFQGESPALPEKGPYRKYFAAWLTSPENLYFAKTGANRVWAHFFARGIAHPIDDMRPDQAPSHPALLALLEKEFKDSGFNTKRLIRAICNSDTYQRTSKPMPKNADDRELFSHMAIKVLTPDQTVDSLNIAIGRTLPKALKKRDELTAIFATREADGDPTEFSHGIPQFLYQMNAGIAKDNALPLGRFTLQKSKEEAVTSLYLAALSRPPKSAELQRMVAHVNKAGDPATAYRNIYWVLLNSAEFIMNH